MAIYLFKYSFKKSLINNISNFELIWFHYNNKMVKIAIKMRYTAVRLYMGPNDVISKGVILYIMRYVKYWVKTSPWFTAKNHFFKNDLEVIK